MELKDKLRTLRTAQHMTQGAVAERLGVSSQTVSKWERGLLMPDISLLPRIAILFGTSIDSLFDLDLTSRTEHRREFGERIHALHEKGDWEGVYQAWIHEIELDPEHYGNYADVMLHVYRKKLYDRDHVERMIALAERAERFCTDDDKRNEIYRIMLQLCSESKDPAIRERGRQYYKKLPSLRHSRDVYAKFVMEGEEYRTQILKNLIYTIGLAECSVRQLIRPDMEPAEQLFYYQRAATLYEAVLDGRYGGFHEVPLLSDYAAIARLSLAIGEEAQADAYIHRILSALSRHLSEEAAEREPSVLLHATAIPNTIPTHQLCLSLLDRMLNTPELSGYRGELCAMRKRYAAHPWQK